MSPDDGIRKDNPLYDAVQRAKEDPNSTYNQPEQNDFATEEAKKKSQKKNSTNKSEGGSDPSAGSTTTGKSRGDTQSKPSKSSSGGSADRDGIGSAGTTPVDPSNPLYDDVKENGGYVVDEETGKVTGGPDGDGTARTEKERTSDRPPSGGSSGSSSGGSPGASGTPKSKSTKPDRNAGDSSSSATASSGERSSSSNSPDPSVPADDPSDTFSADDPRDDLTGEQILYGTGSKVTNENFDEFDTVDDTVVREETITEVKSETVGNLNETTGGEGQAFQLSDIEVNVEEQNGRRVVTSELTEPGRQKLQEESERIARDRAFEQVQQQTERDLDRDDVSFSQNDGQVTARADPLKQTPDVTYGQANAALNASAGGPVQPTSQSEESDPFSGAVSGFEETTGLNVPGEGSLVAEGQSDAESTDNTAAGEAFGGRGDVEVRLRSLSEGFRDEVIDPTSEVAGNIAASEVGYAGTVAADPFGAAIDVGQGFKEGVEQPQQTAESVTSGDFSQFTPTPDRDAATREAQAQGVVQGAGELVNAPGLAVTGIEAGEVALAGIESTEVTSARPDYSTGEFASDAVGAGALLAGRTAVAAEQNPDQFGGQLVGGYIAGAGAVSTARRAGGPAAGRAAGFAVDPPEAVSKRLWNGDADVDVSDAPIDNREALGGRGTGSLLDADEIDAGRGPSRRAQVRGRLERSEIGRQFRDQFNEFRSDESAQLQTGRQRDRGSSQPEDIGQPGISDYDPSRSEVLEGSPRDRMSSDIADRTFTQRRQNQGTFDGFEREPGRTRAQTEGPRRRRDRAQRSEVRADDTSLDPVSREFSQFGGAVGAGVGAGLQERQDAAQAPAVSPQFDQVAGPGFSTEFDTEVGLGIGNDIGNTFIQDGFQGSQTRTGTTTDIDQFQRQDIGNPNDPFNPNEPTTSTPVDPPTDPPRTPRTVEPRSPGDPDVPEFRPPTNDNELEINERLFEEVEFDNPIASARDVLGL